mgnify:CR=1 FL=1
MRQEEGDLVLREVAIAVVHRLAFGSPSIATQLPFSTPTAGTAPRTARRFYRSLASCRAGNWRWSCGRSPGGRSATSARHCDPFALQPAAGRDAVQIAIDEELLQKQTGGTGLCSRVRRPDRVGRSPTRHHPDDPGTRRAPSGAVIGSPLIDKKQKLSLSHRVRALSQE